MASIVQYVERAIFCYWLLQLQIYRCVQIKSVLFSSVRRSRPCWLW